MTGTVSGEVCPLVLPRVIRGPERVVPPSVSPDPGDRVAVSVAPDDVYVFDAETGTALTTAGRSVESQRANQ